MDPSTALIPSALGPYAPLETVLDEARAAGTAEVYGQSVEGRPLLAVRVGDGPVPLLLTAGIHGLEYIGVRTLLEVLRSGPIPQATLWVLPVLNPDAYVRTWTQEGDAPVGALRKNARGVDLNRNFPLPFSARPARLGIAGSPDPASATYRGPAPLSEPETRTLAAFARRVRPRGAVDLHAFMGSLIPARVWRADDWFGYTKLCRAFRQGQAGVAGYVRLSTPIFDVFTGELEDWLHHVLGCWAVCVECFRVDETLRQHWRAPTSFWRFNPREPDSIVARDAAGVRAMLEAMTRAPLLQVRPEAGHTRDVW
ncbi:MAG: M14 family metallopeptidase [Myxococcota bacterium]